MAFDDDLIAQAQQHRDTDHVRDEILDRAQRFAEVLAADADSVRREVAVELIAIVGVPL